MRGMRRRDRAPRAGGCLVGVRGRYRRRMRQPLVLGALWGAAAAVALLVAWQTKAGPTVLHLVGRHGVHLGDVAALNVCAMWAVHGTIGWLRRQEP